MKQALKLTNFKVARASETLTSHNLLTGPNGSGKSALMEAVQYALLGYLPTLGKNNSAIRHYARGEDLLKVDLTVNGETYTRGVRWTEKGSRSIAEIAGEPRLKPREAAMAITAEFGPTVWLLDFGQFVGLTPDKRRQILMDTLLPRMEKSDVEGLVLEKFEPDETLDKAREAKIRRHFPKWDSNDVALWLGDGMESVKAEAKVRRADLRDAEGGVAVLTEDTAELFGLAEQKEDLEEELKEAKAAMTRATADSPDRLQYGRLKKMLSNEEIELAGAKQTLKDTADAAENMEAATKALKEHARTEPVIITKSGQSKQARVRELDRKIADLYAKGKSLAELGRSMKENDRTCPVFDVPCEQDFSEKVDELRQQARELRESVTTLEDERGTLEALLEQEEAAAVDARAEHDRWKEKTSSLEAEYVAAKREAYRFDEATGRVTAGKRKIAELTKSVAAATPPVELDPQMVEGLRLRVEETEKQLEEATAAHRGVLALKKAQEKVEELKAEMKFLTRVENTFKEVRNGILEEHIKPITEKMTAAFVEMGFDWEAFIDIEGESGMDIGIVKDGIDWVTFEAMSMGQRVLFIGSMLQVLAARSDNFKVILIEAGEADPKHVLALLEQMKSVMVDLCMVATYQEIDAPEGWNHIRCGNAK